MTDEYSRYLLPALVAVIGLITALITFFLTAGFTHFREKSKSNAENRAYFEYAKYELNYPINNEDMNFFGEGILLLGENGDKFEEAFSKGSQNQVCSFIVIANETENDLINVIFKTSYTGEKRIEEEFVLPYWKSNDIIYLFQNEFGYEGHSVSDELTIQFTTKTFENLKYQVKRYNNSTYKEMYQRRIFKFFWRNVVLLKKRKATKFQKLKKHPADNLR